MPYSPPDRISDVLAKKEYDLVEAIGQSVTESFQRAIQANGRKPDEVRMFSSFFFLGLPVLERRINYILRNDTITTTVCGIFCHQTPVVRYIPSVDKGTCELSDITFIVTYGARLRDGGLGNAVMMQAKLTESEIRKQKVQTGLYQQGLRFHYTAIKTYGTEERLLPPKDSTALCFWDFCANRLSYSPSYRFHNRTRCIHPLDLDKMNRYYESFDKWLFELLAGLKGRGFGKPSPGENAWSQILFDLLKVTCGKAAGQKNIYAQQAGRLRGKVAQDAIAKLLGKDCFLIKNSFDQIFAEFEDHQLQEDALKIEKNPDRYELEELKEIGMKFDGSGEAEPPRVVLEMQDNPDSEGGTFVLIEIRDDNEHETVRHLPGRRRRILG
jgi:hypothetical protein